MKKDFRYREISNKLARLIKDNILKAGDRLPSVRLLCTEYGISMNTSKRVFLELEGQSLIESIPQSGYFVRRIQHAKLPLPALSRPPQNVKYQEPNELITEVYKNMGRKDLTLFSIGVPSEELLPVASLNRQLLIATRQLKGSGTGYDELAGNRKLRHAIAARSYFWGGRLREDDLITTAGGMNALSFCMMALSVPGDTIAVESPIYPGILQLARSLGLNVCEMPTDPTTGVEIQALKKLIPRIKFCLLVTNFSTPLGYCMPEKNKKEVVELLSKHNIPLIEDDVYGDLFFEGHRPKSCKAFDKDGLVLWCGSISKTLAPGYRVGWVAPGRYKEKMLKLKLVHAISSPAIQQEAVANFITSGRYDHHLRRLRQTLAKNYDHYVSAIAKAFPEGTKISRPLGGLAIWIELDKQINVSDLYEVALKHKISIAPGRMFTLQNQYENCMRLCIGLTWTTAVKDQLETLGRLAKIQKSVRKA